MSDIIHDAKTAYDESVEKMLKAAQQVENLIESGTPTGAKLPRGWHFVNIRSNAETQSYLSDKDGRLVGNDGEFYLQGDLNAPVSTQFAAARALLDDVRDGLLNEIEDWLRNQTRTYCILTESAEKKLKTTAPQEER